MKNASILDLIIKTPYATLKSIGRPDIFLKLECNQFANSFKARGIVNFLFHLENVKGVVAFTTGNHGIAVSSIAREMCIPAIVITTDKINYHKLKILKDNGAKIIQVNYYDFDNCIALAHKVAQDFDYTFVPIYGNRSLLDGYSGIVKEIYNDFNRDMTLFFPIGTGSLLKANAKVAKEINANTKIIGVEPKIYQRLNGSLHFDNPSLSIADSLAIDKIPLCNMEMIKYTNEIVAIEEELIMEATKIIYNEFNMITEAAGAITLAAALKNKPGNSMQMAIITGKNTSNRKSK